MTSWNWVCHLLTLWATWTREVSILPLASNGQTSLERAYHPKVKRDRLMTCGSLTNVFSNGRSKWPEECPDWSSMNFSVCMGRTVLYLICKIKFPESSTLKTCWYELEPVDPDGALTKPIRSRWSIVLGPFWEIFRLHISCVRCCWRSIPGSLTRFIHLWLLPPCFSLTNSYGVISSPFWNCCHWKSCSFPDGFINRPQKKLEIVSSSSLKFTESTSTYKQCIRYSLLLRKDIH